MTPILLAGAWLAFLPEMHGFVLKWALLYVAVAAMAAAFAMRSWHERPALDRATAIFAGLIGWAALSLAWSDDWRTGLVGVANATACFALFCWARRNATKVAKAAAYSAIGACFLAVALPFSNGGLGNPNFLAEFLLIAAPFLFVFKAGRIAAVGVAAVLLFKIDALVGAAIAGTWTPGFSLAYRLELWTGTALMWLASPFWGHGLGSFDYLFQFFAPDTTVLAEASKSAGAAHNDYLQLLAELGIVGAGLAVALVREAWRKPRTKLERAATASLVVAGLLALVGFPLQNPVTAALAALALGIATSRSPQVALVEAPRLRIGTAFASGAVAILLVGFGTLASIAQVNYSVASAAQGRDPLTTYAAVKTAYRVFPFERAYRHNLYPAAFAAADRISEAEIAWAERVASTAMPYSSQTMILRAASIIECCPNEAEVLITELERRHIGGHIVPDLRLALENRR